MKDKITRTTSKARGKGETDFRRLRRMGDAAIRRLRHSPAG